MQNTYRNINKNKIEINKLSKYKNKTTISTNTQPIYLSI